MLGISKLMRGTNRMIYGVVDTDDNTEEFISTGELTDAVHAGLDIGGVVLDANNSIDSVEIWEGLRFQTSVAVKAYVMIGLELRGWDGDMSYIRWNADKVTWPVQLRLSDYGTSISDWFLGSVTFRDICLPNNLTLIIDDKLKLSKNAFYTSGGRRAKHEYEGAVILDIRELTNEAAVRDFYAAMKPFLDSTDNKGYFRVLDDKLRYAGMRGQLC